MSQPFWRAYYNDVDPEDPDSSFPLVRKLNISNINLQENAIVGAGSHEHFGAFQIAGSCEGEKVCFKLKYNEKELSFQGNRNNDCIEGEWCEEQDCPIGNFKFERIVPRHGWNGHYCQFGLEHEMVFNNLIIETVPNGKVTGSGGDENGNFEISGEYDHITNGVRFTKTYENKSAFKYWGTINGKTVKGHWGNKETKPMGDFEFYFLE